MSKIHKNLNIIAITTRDPIEQKDALLKIIKIIKSRSIDVIFESHVAQSISLEGYEFSELIKRAKVIVSLGGDGNFIATCRRAAQSEAYIYGVHTGHLGFLTDSTLDEFGEFLDQFLNGIYDIERPYMLRANFNKNGIITTKLAFNDIVLMRKKIDTTSYIDAFLNSKHFNSYFGDGVIISSAMGSTAYNMSAGGPIIYPLCDAYSVTPICSHSLTQRPLVLPREFRLEFRSNDDVVVLIDGQDRFDLIEFDSVDIGVSDIRVNLLRQKGRDYFGVLKEKLRWGQQ
ncbi:NAD(+) kinase [Campylobacter lanienae]|uniref:NAD(+) kinase n=1 Tax=Campylobacter lanienae TaxID=75658 RepID=UPI00242A9BCF|nr:NAD(+) kinase [Campylobacter lanienae]MCI5539265.1 NAD(+) kinase [Campylobacter lanienae]MDY5519867.1 NAD(+) kinase [Campylobacter lanienae]